MKKADLYCTYHFSLKCLAEHIKYESLIQVANHEDFFDLYPRFGRKKKFLIQMYFHKCNERYCHVYV